MRYAITIAALAATVFLHIYTMGEESSGTQIPKEQTQISNKVLGPVSVLAEINACRQGDRITVAGRIGDLWEPTGERAPHTLILRDESGALEIVHWLRHPPRVDIGDAVQCTGTVDLYRGKLQLRLWTPGELQVLSHGNMSD